MMLTIRNLNKSFGSLKVLDNLNLDVKEGEVIAIIGSSGSGKSTLLRSINYLEQPESGTIQLEEYKADYKHMHKKDIKNLRENTAMVFQSFALFRNKTALQNVMEPLVTVKKVPKAKAKEMANNLLKQVGLEDKTTHYPSQLSGGQKQRVGIARAMASNPKLLLFDEPTSALDPELVKEVLGVISDLAKEKKTMLIVTHEMQFARRVADRIVFLDHGHIVAQGAPEELFTNPNEKLQKFIQDL